MSLNVQAFLYNQDYTCLGHAAHFFAGVVYLTQCLLSINRTNSELVFISSTIHLVNMFVKITANSIYTILQKCLPAPTHIVVMAIFSMKRVNLMKECITFDYKQQQISNVTLGNQTHLLYTTICLKNCTSFISQGSGRKAEKYFGVALWKMNISI